MRTFLAVIWDLDDCGVDRGRMAYEGEVGLGGEVLLVVGEDVVEFGVDDVLDDLLGLVSLVLHDLVGEVGDLVEDGGEPEEDLGRVGVVIGNTCLRIFWERESM